jgi:hypothetical protein
MHAHADKTAAQPNRAATGRSAQSPIQKKADNQTGLPDQLKGGIEALSGMSMDHVRVHYNSSRPAQLNALAYAQGSEIHVAAGQERHVPHEAWHVVQQAQGRVAATRQMKGNIALNDQAGLEREADEMGARALGHQSAWLPPRSFAAAQAGVKPVVQREIDTSASKTPKDKHENLEKVLFGMVQTVKSVSQDEDQAIAEPAQVAATAATTKAFKGNNVDPATKKVIEARIKARGGVAKAARVEDTYFSQEKDSATWAKNVASMANDPRFEATALRFEERIGVLAHNHPKAEAVCKKGGARVLEYLDTKHREAADSVAEIDNELKSFGMADSGWSGAVGKNAEAIKKVLGGGSVGEMVAHVEAFVTNVLMKDVMENHVPWRTFAADLGLDRSKLDRAYARSAFTGDKYLGYELPKGSAGERQWHSRVKIVDEKGEFGRDMQSQHHPSGVKAPGAGKAKPGKTTRKKAQITEAAPIGIGLKLGEQETAFQQSHTHSDTALNWEEGARLWLLNEFDSWVYTQRQLSLPLVAGPSGTSARIMQAFDFLSAGPAADVRLAAIGALLPPRHHTLVEVMFGCEPYGAPPYDKGPKMYHQLAPLTDEEIRTAAGLYPDEMVDPYGVRDARSHPDVPLPALPGPVDQSALTVSPPAKSGGLAAIMGLSLFPASTTPVVTAPIVTTPVPGPQTGFGHTRRTLNRDFGVSRWRDKPNSTTGRMLKAMDRYQSAPNVSVKMTQLVLIEREASSWLASHGASHVILEKTKNAYRAIARDARAAIDSYQAQYLYDLGQDHLFADKLHAEKGRSIVAGHGDAGKLAQDHGLTAAEVAALHTYTGPAYKYINAGLEGDPKALKTRLGGFVRETKTSEGFNGLDKVALAEKARTKLVGSTDPVAKATSEAGRHATVAMMGMMKLPPYTGMVYAGGCITKQEAFKRFKTGTVSERKAFSSTTTVPMTAGMFAATKLYDMKEAYDPKRDPPEAAPFPFVLHYISKTGRDVMEFSPNKGEQEILFAPGSKLRIVVGADSPDLRIDNKNAMIIAEEVV